MNINPLQDYENIKQHRNLTNQQKRNSLQTKEGVLVNSYKKELDVNTVTMKNEETTLNQQDIQKELSEYSKPIDSRLIPLSSISIGIMSAVALATYFIKQSTKVAQNTAKEKWLPAVTRNVNLSKETSQIIYQMIQSPNKKTFIAGTGVLALSSIAFIGKMFIDGYKDIWIKRKEAKIQKNLQENLIAVETKAFAGKMQIIRNLHAKYSKDFEELLLSSDTTSKDFSTNFGDFLNKHIPFTNNLRKGNNIDIIANLGIGISTTFGIIGLGYLSLKNLTKSKKNLEGLLTNVKETITKIVNSSNETTKEIDKNNLEHLFISIEGNNNIENYISEQIHKLNWVKDSEKEEFLSNILKKLKSSTIKVNPNIGGDGTPKPAFNSFVDDYRAFFYNWLLDTSNPQFKQLFFGITGLTGLSYGGKVIGDAVKEVEVKEINAQTELELQKNLVSTELRNFKSKKEASITPLIEDFYKKARNGASKEDLKSYAENILFEIKNGPPYVYS